MEETTTTTSININLHHPNGGNTMTFGELLTLKEQSMRAASIRALEDGYVVTISLSNKDLNIEDEFQFDDKDQVMSMNQFFDILDRFEDGSSK